MRVIVSEADTEKVFCDTTIFKDKGLNLELTRDTRNIQVRLVYEDKRPVIVIFIQ